MFGSQRSRNGNPDPALDRPPANEVARIQGGGLVQVIVTDERPLIYYLFLNDQLVPSQEIESLIVAVEAPTDEGVGDTVARATLSRYVTNVTGERSQSYSELFPCTLVMVARDRRIRVVCQQAGSLDGLWISLGLRSDGSDSEVTGARSLRVVISQEVLDARLTWMDGDSEDLLSESVKK